MLAISDRPTRQEAESAERLSEYLRAEAVFLPPDSALRERIERCARALEEWIVPR